jgi:hypothetical protein
VPGQFSRHGTRYDFDIGKFADQLRGEALIRPSYPRMGEDAPSLLLQILLQANEPVAIERHEEKPPVWRSLLTGARIW